MGNWTICGCTSSQSFNLWTSPLYTGLFSIHGMKFWNKSHLQQLCKTKFLWHLKQVPVSLQIGAFAAGRHNIIAICPAPLKPHMFIYGSDCTDMACTRHLLSVIRLVYAVISWCVVWIMLVGYQIVRSCSYVVLSCFVLSVSAVPVLSLTMLLHFDAPQVS